MRSDRPTFSSELEPVKLDVQTLSSKLQASLEAMLSSELRGLAVDVDSRPTLSHAPEWRISVPIREPRLYGAISELVNQADMFCRTFVELGTMEPREFTVSVWCSANNEPPIKGSFD